MCKPTAPQNGAHPTQTTPHTRKHLSHLESDDLTELTVETSDHTDTGLFGGGGGIINVGAKVVFGSSKAIRELAL